MNCDFTLTAEQQQCYFRFVEASMRVESKEGFIALIHDYVKPVLPHRMAIAGVGRILPDFRIQVFQMLPIDYPIGYLKAVQRPGGGIQSPIMTRWARTRLPQLYEPHNDKRDDIDPAWQEVYLQHGLGSQAAHGVHDLYSDVTSYFSFCDVSVELTLWHSELLRLLVPHLHMALLQVCTREREAAPTRQRDPLTPREKELLALLLSGKSNNEMARLLGRSEKTIKNLLHQLYGKMEVGSRTQAISRASEMRRDQAGLSVGDAFSDMR